MKVFSVKTEAKIYRRVSHVAEPFKIFSWSSDGSEVTIETPLDDRKYSFKLTRAESLQLIDDLQRYLEDAP